MADGNYWLSHDAQDIDDTIDEVQAARGSEASLSARLADIVSDFETDQQRQETEIGVVAARGTKNVLNLSLTSQTTNGVTFTVNDDQTITVTGTATTSFPTTVGTVSGLSGDYILSGCPSGGSDSTYKLYRAGSSYQADYGEGYTYTFEPQNSHAIRIYLYAGNTFNLTFKPMLRPAEITDDTYAPYAPTNRELYEMILALQSGRSLQSSPASLMQAGRIGAELTDAGNDEEEEER